VGEKLRMGFGENLKMKVGPKGVGSKGIGSKGVINIIELVIVIVTLFVSFNIFFPGVAYKNKWEDAYAVMLARDVILVLDRTEHLHEYAFDAAKMQSFLEKILPESNMILWHSVTGGIKDEIKIACNCSDDAIAELRSWVDGFILNERDVKMTFCHTNMASTDSCLLDSDALLVWGYTPLQQYEGTLTDYTSRGSGIIEVIDLISGTKVDDDSVQKNIFGLKWVALENKDVIQYDKFSRKPRDVKDIIFNPYKYFYHLPMALATTDPGVSIPGCSYDPSKRGSVTFKSISYGFWICNDSYVWFDKDANSTRDTIVKERSNFTLDSNNFNFSLNYINSDSSISISFRPTYIFDDFLEFVYDPGHSDPDGQAIGHNKIAHIEPADGDTDRILIKTVSADPSKEYPVVILNRFGSGNVAWMADFGENGYGYDEKMLLVSLLLWASNKEASGASGAGISNLRAGYMESYVNAKNIDMFELYKFNFGIGFPF
jgi:hypothetical protein